MLKCPTRLVASLLHLHKLSDCISKQAVCPRMQGEDIDLVAIYPPTSAETSFNLP